MSGYRVTKYDPALRRADGAYGRDEWTSVSDVGSSHDGETLTCARYLAVEDAYVDSVHRFMQVVKVMCMRVVDLEITGEVAALPEPLVDEASARLHRVSDGQQVAGEQLDWVVRLALRELLWCRLEGERGFYVHFGYDYYMYIGSDCELVPPPLPEGMYAEVHSSPYAREADDPSR